MFGLKNEDVDMADLIWSYGITVEDFITMKNTGSLPAPLAKAWDEYSYWLQKEFPEEK